MKKVSIGVDDLATTNPEILKEWNYEKNDILPTSVTKGSSRKVWWICKNCGNEWMATPKNRIKGGTGCPVCRLKKIGINHNKAIIRKNGSLFDNRPDLVKEWDYKKNNPLTPKDVTVGSKKKVWWICKKGHEWESRVCNRTSGGSGCIYCTRQKTIIGENDLSTINPELLKEWDYEKNYPLTPKEVSFGSDKKVWWKCPLGHSWRASISKRTNGTGCPYCYSEYGTSFPEQAILYYLSKVTKVESRKKVEKQEIDIYLPMLSVGFEYDGSYYHENEKSKIKEQIKDEIIKNNGINLFHIKESDKFFFDKQNKIIFCKIDRDYKYLENVLKSIQEIINKKINDINIEKDMVKIYNQYVMSIKENNFTINYPELLKEWDYVNNGGLLPESLSAGSNKKVWWKCSKCGSSFITSVNRRIKYPNCPYCSAKKVNSTNNLKSKYPELLKYWDFEKNKNLSPDKLYYRSRTSVWWKCENCGNSYKMQVCSRIKAKTNYCIDCKHKHIGNMNSLKQVKEGTRLFDKRPDLVKEWDYEKNYPLTPKEVSIGSGKKVWWKCQNCGNKWMATIYNRSHGTGCPNCRFSKKIN